MPRNTYHTLPAFLSPHTGDRIRAVLTTRTTSRKIGDMVQLWIVPESLPFIRGERRDHTAVCGTCPHQGSETAPRTCYVMPLAVNAVFRGAENPESSDLPGMLSAVEGRMLRLGAWGDPAMLPGAVLRSLTARASGWTGYTHQWSTPWGRRRSASLRRYVMASVDSPEERRSAKRLGYRTFRVLRSGETPEAGEILCPASPEAGERTTCDACGLCDGSRGITDPRKDIAIFAHGSGAQAFDRWEV